MLICSSPFLLCTEKLLKIDRELNRNLRLKKIYTITAVILLIALYVVIFCFSAEDGESSSRASAAVTEALLKGYSGIVGGHKKALPEMVLMLEGLVRKTAHFTEYLCMGLLSCSILDLWYQPVWRGRLLAGLQILVSASLDEFHQYFIPGRNAAFKDVMIDTAGGVTGIMLFLLFKSIYYMIKRLQKKTAQ